MHREIHFLKNKDPSLVQSPDIIQGFPVKIAVSTLCKSSLCIESTLVEVEVVILSRSEYSKFLAFFAICSTR